MATQLEAFMTLAIEQAKLSLREGNSGFGAVVVRDGEVIASARDTEKTQGDPTAHAEMSAIRAASKVLGRDLSGCAIVSTHEPCPMCTTAVLWSGISTIAYGYSIKDAITQGRRRIDLPCSEIFDRAGKPLTLHAGVLQAECALLYDRQVRDCVKELRDAGNEQLAELADRMAKKRLAWFEERRQEFSRTDESPLDRAYELFLRKLCISADEAPVVERSSHRLTIRSRNFCPTLAACEILGLDTRLVCKQATEQPMDTLLKQIDPALSFSRNYEAIRPHAPYCEEVISLANEVRENREAEIDEA